MDNINPPQTLVMLGRYDSHLAEAVRRFEVPLECINLGTGDTVKYGVFCRKEVPYLLIVSQATDLNPNPVTGHNVALTVTSRYREKNYRVAQAFQDQTNIPLKLSVPERVRQIYEGTGIAFPIFEKNSQLAMEVLRRR